jgi:VIT1/CCC1 family predicted Fe2+/Mn2+ transporter
MMVEELGLIEETESPIKNAIVTFVSFAIFGFMPVLPFIIGEIA